MGFFFFSIFYDALILFTSRFFIVVSAPEEVELWKMNVCVCVCVSIFFLDDVYGLYRVQTRPSGTWKDRSPAILFSLYNLSVCPQRKTCLHLPPFLLRKPVGFLVPDL